MSTVYRCAELTDPKRRCPKPAGKVAGADGKKYVNKKSARAMPISSS
jgi:hypothetical protein